MTPTSMQTESKRELSYAEAIRDGLSVAMERDSNVMLIGEGVPDPKFIFGTTKDLQQQFGEDRVLDMPLAENGMTGVCIGAALMGMRPVMVHQRVDFALLALDQLINNAAKWHYMFAGEGCVPLVVRLIVGRGWGQGPQHSQSLQALFAHIPGLKVVMPATPYDAKGMLIAAIEDNNPVIFMEHRWLHGVKDDVPDGYYKSPIDNARLIRKGSSVTIAAFSYMVLEAMAAADILVRYGIEAEVVDMRSVSPLDVSEVESSVKKTRHLVVADTASSFVGIGSELVSQITERCFECLAKAPLRLGNPAHPLPTGFSLSKHYYPDVAMLVSSVMGLCCKSEAETSSAVSEVDVSELHDVPNISFTGPF